MMYFADPMCSWCWGFAPVVSRLVDALGDSMHVQVVLGGLAPGAVQPLSAPTKVEIRHHWEKVHEQTGQPFDFEFFERESYVYDTEPACRAVVAMRRLRPEAKLAYLTRIQEAFHSEGADPTDAWVLRTLAAELGVKRDAFATVVDELETHERTRADFALSRELGVQGFPTMLLVGEGPPRVIAQGYRRYTEILADLEPSDTELPEVFR
ncbi:MAG: DsbA family protein [Deltaproteobacteria bacterium]|nr:DsbA family protein [Deltaproteobacteria bacterium]